ncbi:MAG: lytic transglycosylase domain-containing protein [Elusimicrobia bacterium]|nr:lytic transglycosylase domain-containing protein [Elusimicrobiota bacterium]
MKRLRLLRPALAGAVLLATPLRAQRIGGVDIEALLRALAAVESGSDPRAIGRAGERSQWQIRPATWRQYTRAPFAAATTNEVLAQLVARTHLRTLLAVAERRHGAAWRHFTPHGRAAEVARRWNPRAPAAYAKRVANLYEIEAARK